MAEELILEMDSRFHSDPIFFRNIVHDELINEGSLLDAIENSFGIHQLIREFLIFETKDDPELFKKALIRANRVLRRRSSAIHPNRMRWIDGLFDWHDDEYSFLRQCSVSLLWHVIGDPECQLGLTQVELKELIKMFRISISLYKYDYEGEELLNLRNSAKHLIEQTGDSEEASTYLAYLDLDQSVLDMDFCKTDEAYSRIQKIFTTIEGTFIEYKDDLCFIYALTCKARIMTQKNMPEYAKALYIESLSAIERSTNYDVDSREAIWTCFELGVVLRNMGYLNESEKWYRKSFTMDKTKKRVVFFLDNSTS